MKKINIILFCWMMLFSACSDMLDKNPTSQPSESIFWQSKKDFELALASCYGSFIENNVFTIQLPKLEGLSDNGYCQHEKELINIAQGNIDPTSGSFISSYYSSAYKIIARLNIFIDKIQNYTGSDISQQEKENYIGQCTFLRAHCYSFLYRCYGDVLLATEPLDLETQNSPKSTAAEVLRQIMDDLDTAISACPDVTYAAAKGRVTKSTALALKARIMLYDAYDTNGNAIPEKMQEILSLLQQVKGYTLANSYESVFQPDTQEGNPEIMFSIKYLAPNSYHSLDQWLSSWVISSPLKNFVDAYEFSDGTAFSESDPRYDPEAPLAGRDPRLEMTVSRNYVVINGVTQPRADPAPTSFILRKFVTKDETQIPFDNNTRSEQDWVILRYADVLLMTAEAENELNGPTQNVYNAINAIRTRPGIDLPVLAAGLSKDEMREKIRHERRIELAFEGERYFDLKRWKTIGTVMNQLTDPTLPLYKPYFEERFYRWPLPQSEIDKSNGVLKQNPDYI